MFDYKKFKAEKVYGGEPQGHLEVAVLTGDVSVDVLDGGTGLQGDEVTHPGRVSIATRGSFLVMGPRRLGGLGNPLVGNVADSRRPHLCQSIVTLQ